MLLAEADHSCMPEYCMARTTVLLCACASAESIVQKNTKGNNVVHLAALRGNLEFLEVALPMMHEKSKKFREDVLQATNGDGKSCLEVHIKNTKIKDLLRKYYKKAGNVRPRPDERTDRLPEDTKRQRKHYRN